MTEFSYKATVYYGAGVEHDTQRREALQRAVSNAGGSDLQIAPEDADLEVSFHLPADSADGAKFAGDTAMTVARVSSPAPLFKRKESRHTAAL